MSKDNLNKYIMVSISPFLMQFNNYYTRFIKTTDTNLSNDWGWFVDIELNSEPTKIVKNKNKYNKYKYKISVQPTIKEYSSIRSMKSIKNLHDTYNTFDVDENYNGNSNTNTNTNANTNANTNTNEYISVYANLMGIIILGFCFYIVKYN